MKQEQSKRSGSGGGIGAGSSSILVIFVVLALTAFATLSLVSAGSDLRLTKRIAASTKSYYEADGVGVSLAGELEAAVRGADTAEIPAIASRLGWTVTNTELTRSIPVDGEQTLELTADFSEGALRFTHWQLVNASQWQEEDSFHLWGSSDASFSEDGAPMPGSLAGLPAGIASNNE